MPPKTPQEALGALGVGGFTPSFFTPVKPTGKPDATKEQPTLKKGVENIIRQIQEPITLKPAPSRESEPLTGALKSMAELGQAATTGIGRTLDIIQGFPGRLATGFKEDVPKGFTEQVAKATEAVTGSEKAGLALGFVAGLIGPGKKVPKVPSVVKAVKGAPQPPSITPPKGPPPPPGATKIAEVPGSGGRKIVPQVFREDKLDLSPEDQKAVVDRLSVLGLESRGVKTFGEMQEAAQALGLDANSLLKEVRQSRITDAEVVALRNLVSGAADELTKLEKQIIQNPTLEATLRPKINTYQSQLDTALKKLVRGGTEAGRAVVAFRIMANKSLDPAVWLTHAKRMLGEREMTTEVQNHILNLIESGDRIGLANYVSMLRTPSLAEKAATLWKAGLLTSPTTHMANILGNTTMAVLESATNVVSTGFDVVGSLATGKRTVTVSPATIAAKIKAIPAAAKEAKDYLKTGVYSQELLSKYDLPKQIHFENKILEGYTQAVFRSLGAEDIFFRKVAMEESLETSARVIAKNEGLKGEEYVTRVRSLLQEPTNDMVMSAIDTAEYATFQSKNLLADLAGAAKSKAYTKNPWAGAFFEFIAPFTKTPANVAARVASYSPLGFVRAVIRAIPPETRSQALIVKDLGRATVGSSLMAIGSYLATKGLMTGNVPTGKSERDQFFAEGKQANALRIGDNWYQLNRISPAGNLLALGAEFHRLGREKEGLSLGVSTIGAGVKGLTQMTFLKGISSTLELLNDPDANTEKFINNATGSLIPAFIGRTARTIDPTMRIPEDVLDAVQARTPLLTEKVAVRRDVFGRKVVSPSGRFALVDPFNITKAREHPVLNEATRLGLAVGLPSQTISNIKLSNEEYSLYQKAQGKLLENYLTTMIESDGYKLLNDSEKEKRFKSAIDGFREEINKSVFPALMVKRYQLPLDTNPELLLLVLREVGGEDVFKKKSTREQSRIISSLLQKAI